MTYLFWDIVPMGTAALLVEAEQKVEIGTLKTLFIEGVSLQKHFGVSPNLGRSIAQQLNVSAKKKSRFLFGASSRRQVC